MVYPSINHSSNGDTSITAASPRPLEQAVAGLRRTTGWTIDYEDSQYKDSDVKPDADGRMQLVGGKFTAVLPKLETSTSAESETQIKSLVNAYNQKISGHKFKVIQSGDSRFDVVPDDQEYKATLDTLVQIEPRVRSLDSTIGAILAAVSNKLGIKISQGGLMDGDLIRTKMSSKAEGPVPARQLLAEVLANAHSQKFWILANETSDRNYYLGIQTAVKTSDPVLN